MKFNLIVKWLVEFAYRLPLLNVIMKKKVELDRRQTELDQRHMELDRRQAKLENIHLKAVSIVGETQRDSRDNIDLTPWRHPYLTKTNISRFRDYSESVWQFAHEYSSKNTGSLDIAFSVNLAQSMYKWAKLMQNLGARATLYPASFEVDHMAISRPEWEEFDSEFSNIYDGVGFLAANPEIAVQVPVKVPTWGDTCVTEEYRRFWQGDRQAFLTRIHDHPGVKYLDLLSYADTPGLTTWAEMLSTHQVIYTAYFPFPAYASGRPYCVFSVGSDLQEIAGRSGDYGRTFSLAFGAARFLMISNPHTLGHSRRLGLTNGVYLPYPMDDSRYSPGEGQARHQWELQYGGEVYVLMTSRLDKEVKGQDGAFTQSLFDLARDHPELRFIFLGWGGHVESFRSQIQETGLTRQLIILPAVGKTRLIDYYRSCDIVLDQFVYGYYGATALEAAAVGKPVVMKLHEDQYHALYRGDTMPALNASTPAEMAVALETLIKNPSLRKQAGQKMRQWLVRNHGEERTAPMLLALLRLAADEVPLPPDLINPLTDPLSDSEQAYHQSCLREPKP